MSNRIVVGMDDSDCAFKALEWAIAEAELRNAKIVVIHAETYVNWIVPGGLATYEETQTALKAEAERFLTAAIKRATDGHDQVVVEHQVVNGPAAEILKDASKDAELLVVGSHGRGGFAGMLLGSVSQQIVQHAHCPVVVVR